MTSNEEPLLLEITGVSKSFSGTIVLNQVSFDLRVGEVHALMGENGAGKSTLMRVLAGIHPPDSGFMSVRGKQVSFSNPAAARAEGIAIIHQELNVVPDMTVAENLALGAEPRNKFGLLSRKELRKSALQKLALVESTINPDQPMGSLSIGMQQLVEIARAMSENSRILILDEPTAALSNFESAHLFKLIYKIRNEGLGLVYISHRMEEVWKLADRITVLRDGHNISTRDRVASTPTMIVTDMIGRELVDLYAHAHNVLPNIALTVNGITNAKGIGPVSFNIRKGEIVGMFGLIGAGRTEIARLLFGADPKKHGSITRDTVEVNIREPRDAIRAGIGFLTEDRRGQGLLPESSILDNASLSSLDKYVRWGVVCRLKLRLVIKTLIDRLSVRRSSLQQRVTELSGGNQQKVLIARWLDASPRVLILDEPTRGVDIGAKEEIYRVIDTLAGQGVAILMISSDLQEILGMSDRVIVVRDGIISGEVLREFATEEIVMMHATGVSEGSIL